jgi:low temperature requirement protein LtrA
MSSLLRPRRRGHHAEVTSVELFFDLVFVIAVTQVSHALLEHLTWLGALEAAILLLCVWWAWIDTAWITNWLDPQRVPVRLMLFVLMGIGIVMSSSIPEAFGERGLAFALAFVAIQWGRTAFMLWAVREHPQLFRNFVRIAIWYLVGGILWIAGGLLEGDIRIIVWIIAAAIDFLAAITAFWIPGFGSSHTRDWTIDGGLMAERAGLFVMIALGESVLATGIGFTRLEWTTDVILAMTAALIQSIAMWSIYFGEHAERARRAIAAHPDPGGVARYAYTYIPILLVAGIIVCAVGDDIAIAHPNGHEGHMDAATVAVLICGPVLFLAGAALFKLNVFGTWSLTRLGGIAALLALWPVSGMLTPLTLTIATTTVVTVVAAIEMVWLARNPMPTTAGDTIPIEE